MPVALYVAGNVDVLNDPQLAIVGSRNPTARARHRRSNSPNTLAARGLGITSGLAEGIDSAAHRGALRRKASPGRAGIGSRRHLSPRAIGDLSEEIERQGA